MDARASLLIDGTNGLGDPMTVARVTLLGEGRRMMNFASSLSRPTSHRRHLH
jgi:hypothetical protein